MVGGKGGGNGILDYFRYVDELKYQQCENPFSRECTENFMEEIGISPYFIRKCMNHTNGLESDYGVDSDTDNSYLNQELQKATTSSIREAIVPVLKIENLLYEFAETTEDIFRAVCAAYPINKQPIACDFCKGCNNVRDCLWRLQCDGLPFEKYAAAKMFTEQGMSSATAGDLDTTVPAQSSATANVVEQTNEVPAAVTPIPNLPTSAPPVANAPGATAGTPSGGATKMTEAKDAMVSGLVLGLAIGFLVTAVFACRDWQAKIVLNEIAKEDLNSAAKGIELDDTFPSPRSSQDMEDRSFRGVRYSDDPSADVSAHSPQKST